MAIQHNQNKGPRLFLIALALCMLTLGAILGLQKAQASSEWRPLSDLVSEQKLTDIISENTAPSADIESLSELAIGYEQGDLLVVDFKSSTLCGVGGCAIAAYQVSTGNRILFTYAIRPGRTGNIVEVIERENENLPCIQILRREATESEIICYEENSWSTNETS